MGDGDGLYWEVEMRDVYSGGYVDGNVIFGGLLCLLRVG